jgi:5-methylcytosine-specific restriction endonuclease McrA
VSALQTSVLVLNQNYEPLNVCNVKRAIVLLDHGKAEVIEESSALLRSFRAAFRIPSVIRMVYYIKRPRPQARLSRREVFARDNFACQYCGIKTSDLTLDHVTPRHQGGGHSWENLVAACRACNHRKAGRTPEQARMTLRSTPRRPRATLLGIFRRYLESHPGWQIFFPGAPHAS